MFCNSETLETVISETKRVSDLAGFLFFDLIGAPRPPREEVISISSSASMHIGVGPGGGAGIPLQQ
jgi:hypothetical protein